MANLAGFDASTVPDMMEFSAVPEGQYIVIITNSEMKPTKTGTGSYLNITFDILDGPYKGRKLWSRLNLNNPNSTAVDIARRELGAICRAVGVTKPTDSAELHNKPLLVTVAVEINDRKQETNTIKKYEAATPGATPIAAPAPMATVAAPAAQAQAWQPAVAQQGGTPPWRQ